MPDPLAPPAVKLLGQTWSVDQINSLGLRYRIASMAGEAPELAAAICLGLCVPRIRKNGPSFNLKNLGQYGQDVMDHLLEKGATYSEIVVEGIKVFRWMASSLPRAKVINDAEDFTEAGKEK